MSKLELNKIHEVVIEKADIQLNGLLYLPSGAVGIVLFAHGSGSSRFSVRNQAVAKVLNDAGLATLLFDLLMPDEEATDELTGKIRFDIEFLASRLIMATDWICNNESIRDLEVGYFGASTGGGAALVAAAQRIDQVKAVVSRGGRPDLAGKALELVQAPTLLIVGGNDFQVIEMNEEALDKLMCVKKLVIVEGATHLFEEPGTLEQVASVACQWFLSNF